MSDRIINMRVLTAARLANTQWDYHTLDSQGDKRA